MGTHLHTVDNAIPPAVGQHSQPIILKVPEPIGPSRDHLHLVVEALSDPVAFTESPQPEFLTEIIWDIYLSFSALGGVVGRCRFAVESVRSVRKSADPYPIIRRLLPAHPGHSGQGAGGRYARNGCIHRSARSMVAVSAGRIPGSDTKDIPLLRQETTARLGRSVCRWPAQCSGRDIYPDPSPSVVTANERTRPSYRRLSRRGASRRCPPRPVLVVFRPE